MSDVLNDYLELKEKIDQLQKEADRAEGALDVTLKEIKQEHGCNSLEEATTTLKKLERSIQTTEKELKQLLSNFSERYGKQLEEE